MYQILSDKEVLEYYDFVKIIPLFEKIFIEKTEGTYLSPPRHTVASQLGSLVFTIGGSSSEVENVIGFRVYDTFHSGPDSDIEKQQLNTVFNNTTGELLGIIIGNLIGPIRTAVINALAIKKMSRKESTILGVIGTGKQARWHIEAACAVRKITKIKIFSRRKDLRDKFAESIGKTIGIETISCSTSKEAVENVDILLCLTTSKEPIFNSQDISPGTHINSIGPKFIDAHEIPLDLIPKAKLITTDSLEQIRNYAESFFLSGTTGIDQMIELSELVSEKITFNRKSEDITLFCSVGLAGTEVILSKFILNESSKNTSKNY